MSPITTPGSGGPTGSTSSGPTGSTSSGPTGQTGSTPTGATAGSLEDLTNKAAEAHKKKDEAEAAIANAEKTKAAAEDVSNKLSSLNMYKFDPNTRFRRQAASTTTTYPTPTNCNDLKSTMTALTNAMDSSSADYNTARATAIVAILTSVARVDLSPA